MINFVLAFYCQKAHILAYFIAFVSARSWPLNLLVEQSVTAVSGYVLTNRFLGNSYP